MLVRQPSYVWVGVLLGIGVVIALLLGANIGESELLNPERARITAEAARAVLTQRAEDRQRMFNATATSEARADTATAVSAIRTALENERNIKATAAANAQGAMIRATSAAQATWTADQRRLATSTPRATPQNKSSVASTGTTGTTSQEDLGIDTGPLILLIVIIAVALLGLCGVVWLQYRVTLADAKAAQLQQAARVAEAEARRYERQAEMLREQHRTAQVAAAMMSTARNNGQTDVVSSLTHVTASNHVVATEEDDKSRYSRW